MQKEWPSLSCPSSDNVQFWTHEWEKHGTCSESVLDQHSYFETTLNLKEKSNILGALKSAGKFHSISPSHNYFHNDFRFWLSIMSLLIIVKKNYRNSAKWEILQLRRHQKSYTICNWLCSMDRVQCGHVW